MRLIEGLHAIQMRRLKGLTWRGNGKGEPVEAYLFAETVDALAWIPGSKGSVMWAAHTEALVAQSFIEKLSRGAGIDRTATD